MIIESIARKNKNKRVANVPTLLPSYLNESATNLLNFLKSYYDFLETENDALIDYKNLDRTTNTFLDEIQKEIAKNVPDNFLTERIHLFKRLIPWYLTKGSRESIELFFKILFQEDPDVYFPKEDLFIPSSGSYDPVAKVYRDRNGFVSDIKKIRDSRFYQEYSYVIKTLSQSNLWKDSFNRLVHPSGFIFFGQILNEILIRECALKRIQSFTSDWTQDVRTKLWLIDASSISVNDIVSQRLNEFDYISGTVQEVNTDENWIILQKGLSIPHNGQTFLVAEGLTWNTSNVTFDSGLVTFDQTLTDTTSGTGGFLSNLLQGASGGAEITSIQKVEFLADYQTSIAAIPNANTSYSRLSLYFNVPDEGFTPMNIPSLLMWLDSSDSETIVESSGNVSEWQDKSGNLNHAVQNTAGEQPMTGNRTMNGLNSIEFGNGSDHMMDLNANLLDLADGNNTFFMVVRPDALSNDTFTCIRGGSADGTNIQYLMHYEDNGLFTVNNNTSENFLRRETASSASNDYIIAIKRDGNKLYNIVDGNVISAGFAQDSGLMDVLTIGGYISGGSVTNKFDGLISEVIVSGQALANSVINDIGNYLGDKWGVTWVDLPINDPVTFDSDMDSYFTSVEAAGGSFNLSGISGGYTEEYTKDAHNDLVVGLKSDGVWTDLTELYLFAGKTFGAGAIGVKLRGTGTLTNNGFVSGDYTAAGSGAGLKGDGSSTIATGIFANTLNQFNTHMLQYVNSNAGEFGMDHSGASTGNSQSNDRFSMHASWSNGRIYSDQYNSGNGNVFSPSYTGSPIGLVIGSRTGTGIHQIFRNGVQVAVDTSSGGNLPNLEIDVFTNGSINPPSSYKKAIYGFGNGLSTTEQALVSNRLNAFATALGFNSY